MRRDDPDPATPATAPTAPLVTRRVVLGGALAATVAGVAAAAPALRAQAAGAGAAGDQPAAAPAGGVAVKPQAKRMPTIYLPHGGGPCFFMEWAMGPPDTWAKTAAWLRALPGSLPAPPRALLVVSAHWEERLPTLMTGAQPPLLFDYYGFPDHTYRLRWPAPGAPAVAARAASLLGQAGIATATDAARGFDHGVFVPLLMAWPRAEVPTLQLSLQAGLDPAQHLAIGRALAPLRDEGVLIIGSGMSYHNMRGFGRPEALAASRDFDAWLESAAASVAPTREAELVRWAQAPRARACHPREEHLLPLMVCAGAGGADAGRVDFRDQVMAVQVSALRFG